MRHLIVKNNKNYEVKVNKYIKNTKRFRGILNKIDPSFRDRKFTVGGSSECWAGYIKPFEESTFKNKFPLIEEQSWGEIELSQYNKEVLELLNSPINNFSTKQISEKLNINLPTLFKDLYYSCYAFAPEPLRLKNFWKKTLFDNKKELIFGFKLVDFKYSVDKIKFFIFENKKKELLIVKAEYFILAMGGIENAKFANKVLQKSHPQF